MESDLKSLSKLDFKDFPSKFFDFKDSPSTFPHFDKKLNDPVWETVSLKIKKYSPFLNIDVPHYKKILLEVAR